MQNQVILMAENSSPLSIAEYFISYLEQILSYSFLINKFKQIVWL